MNLELNCKEFESYIVDNCKELGGVQYIFRFPNDYGASVVKNMFSYGHQKDLWELGVVIFDGDVPSLTYNTKITDDVCGNLTDEDVAKLLKEIRYLG